MEKNYSKREARRILTNYLQNKRGRKTIERFAILNEIYSQNSHFDITSLHLNLLKKNQLISLATLYNTIDILIDAKLIIKHRLPTHRKIIYERALKQMQHDHLICLKCDTVMEFSDTTRIDIIKKNAMKKFKFIPHHHTLYIYGTCEKCKKHLRKSK